MVAFRSTNTPWYGAEQDCSVDGVLVVIDGEQAVWLARAEEIDSVIIHSQCHFALGWHGLCLVCAALANRDSSSSRSAEAVAAATTEWRPLKAARTLCIHTLAFTFLAFKRNATPGPTPACSQKGTSFAVQYSKFTHAPGVRAAHSSVQYSADGQLAASFQLGWCLFSLSHVQFEYQIPNAVLLTAHCSPSQRLRNDAVCSD